MRYEGSLRERMEVVKVLCALALGEPRLWKFPAFVTFLTTYAEGNELLLLLIGSSTLTATVGWWLAFSCWLQVLLPAQILSSWAT